jgi:cellulose synthase/poly-beta-1,6-N-acetylglucosamine synthase-like glycosyltransferase
VSLAATSIAAATGLADVTLVVPIRDEAATLPIFLKSLDGQQVLPKELILVDAGSTDATRHVLEEYAATVACARVVDAESAYPGGARNIGVQLARSDWVAMTDAGTVVDPQWLAELLGAVDADPTVDAVFGTYEPLVQTFFQRCLALCFLTPGRVIGGHRYRGPSTASLLLKKSVWKELGGFPEHLRACEDLLFFRTLMAGPYRTACAPRAVVHWRLPGTFAQVFRRFRTYSHHTLKAGLGSEWHAAVAMMYAAATVCLLLGAVVHWSVMLLPVVGLALRAIQSARRRPDVPHASGASALREYAAVCVLLLWIDFSAMVGVFDYAHSRLSRT